MQVSQAGCKGRATSVGEAVDVTCTEHNHPQDQASNKAKKLMFATRKGRQYSLIGIYMSYNIKQDFRLSTCLFVFFNIKIELIVWQIDLVGVDLVAS